MRDGQETRAELRLVTGEKNGYTMLHIFAEPGEIRGDCLTIAGSQVNHIKNVLRMRPGDELYVTSPEDGKKYRFSIECFTQAGVECRLCDVEESSSELPVRVLLFQGLPKSDKMDMIVQKSVELGVTEIYPVEMKRCVMRLEGPKRQKRTARWQAIAEGAAQQSRRGILPIVHEPVTMAEAVRIAEEQAQFRVIPYELQEDDGSTKALFDSLEEGQTAAVFIGPEGGLSPEEVEMAGEHGIRPVSLGKRILRTETAAMVFMSWVIWKFEIT